jgi:uncharacterized protein with HEPN domain
MPKRENILLVDDLINCFIKIINYTQNLTYEEFLNDDKTVDAVIRNFEIIGEASKLLTEDFKSKHSQVEWKLLTGFRNRLIHEYFGVDYDTLWTVIQNEVQQYLDFLQTIEKL